MSVLEHEKAQIASLASKLEEARKTISAQSAELNDLRSKVVALEDASVVDALKLELAYAQNEASVQGDRTANLEKELAKAQRDLAAAGPALALAAAVAAVKA